MRTLTVLIAAAAWAQSPADLTFFETKVRPVLATQCYGCHSASAKTPFALLRVDSRAGLIAGGDSGPAIVPGKPDESRLVQVLRYTGTVKMPPSGRLKAEETGAIAEWIAKGAPWPEESAPAATVPAAAAKGKDHWAFQPVAKPAVPSVRDGQWPRGDIDRFILARLEKDGLTPANEAGRHVLLRRVTFDLTGLPPSPEEMDSFANDASPDAYDKVVARLLDTPGFGERFARHWLDGAYYADNIEIGRRIPAREAWRYRDYVIAAFNSGTPYDLFLREQIAGDLMPAATPEDRKRQVTATGFLALGPWALVQADKEQLRMDVVDMQLDAIGKTVLGLTLGCARCHDHKFDPLPQRDYYAMAGMFRSTRTLSGRVSGIFSDINRVPLPESSQEMRRRSDAMEKYERAIGHAKTEAARANKEKRPAKEIAELRNRVDILEYTRPDPPSAYALTDVDFPEDCRINIRGNASMTGGEVARGAIGAASPEPMARIADFTSGRLELANWIVSPKNALTARVAVNRIWYAVFGQGIVPTIDNFGLRGQMPSHPELLDYLANRFVEGKWSVKNLVREMVLSRTYRQASGVEYPKAAGIDPGNRLLWRMNARRLEAEAIRDAMLAVTGELDPARGGPSLPLSIPGNANLAAKPEFIEDRAKLGDDLQFRRTIYLPNLRRGQLQSLDVLNLFDSPDNNQVTGARTSTTVPTQALFLMNSEFVRDRARTLARSLLARGSWQDNDRVARLTRVLLNRAADVPDLALALGFLREFEARGQSREEAWTRYCQALLVSNEFLYRR